MNPFHKKVFLKLLIVFLAFLILSCSKEVTLENSTNIVNANININSNKTVNIVPPNYRGDPKLQSQADSLLALFGNMQSVPVFLTDEPIIKTGSDTQKGVAYTTCENKNVPTIFVKNTFYQTANQKQLTNILKHELTHAWFCRQGIQVAHDEHWRKKFKQVGGFGN